MDTHAEPAMASQANSETFYSAAEGISCGITDQETAPPSSPLQHLSAHKATTTPGLQAALIEREIEASKVHWSECNSKWAESDADDSEIKSNREIVEELRQLPKYRIWLNPEWDAWDVDSVDDFVLGRKLAEGGQAEIFEVEDRRRKKTDPRYVFKVFKEGYSVRTLQHQWPQGILECGSLIRMVARAGMVLQDDRFACLLLRCHIDLRKLIDIAREDNSALWEARRRPFQEFLPYEPQRHGLNPKPLFKIRCALNIMNHIAWGMLCLHNNDVRHRDLKAANVLCTDDNSNAHSRSTLSGENQKREDRCGGRCISVDVADFESSLGTVGTGFWRAPEILQQLKDGKPGASVEFTPAADVYSYAMTCYEILTGCIPLEGCKNSDYDQVVVRKVRPILPDYVPRWVRDLVQKCWHHDPSERPTFSSIWQELRSRGMPHPHRNPVVLEAPNQS